MNNIGRAVLFKQFDKNVLKSVINDLMNDYCDTNYDYGKLTQRSTTSSFENILVKASVTVRYIFVYCRLLSLFAKNL